LGAFSVFFPRILTLAFVLSESASNLFVRLFEIFMAGHKAFFTRVDLKGQSGVDGGFLD